jgi:hypothetical protein
VSSLDRVEASVHKQGVLLEAMGDNVRLLAEKIGTLDASVNQRIDTLAQTERTSGIWAASSARRLSSSPRIPT